VAEREERSASEGGESGPRLADFLGEPTRDLAAWRWLWAGDHRFPIGSDRGWLGRLVVFCKRLLRPLVQIPQNDLWERQRVFDLILLEHLQKHEQIHAAHDERLVAANQRIDWHDGRLERLEAFWRDGLYDVMRHNDALFSRVDQKLDRLRRETRDLWARLGAALAIAEQATPGSLAEARAEVVYVDLEARFRGTQEEIAERLSIYLPLLPPGPVLDLGCGRGEWLAMLRAQGREARGIDSSRQMVAECRAKELAVEEGDLLAGLAALPAASLGTVASFHVIEHLPPAALDRLVRLAWRALAPGGLLILETPSALSLVVGARGFWLDPTHQRPVLPDTLHLLYEEAGFTGIERLDLHPFPAQERLPEIDISGLPADLRDLGDQINRLRDRLDALLFGYRDYALLGRKAVPAL